MKITPVILFLAVTSAFAQPDSTPINTDAILKELQQIKETRETSIKSQLSKVIQTVNSAATSSSAAMDLYLQANRMIQFNGQNNENMQYQEWKKKEGEKLKSKGFQEALRLYLVYLSLTLQSSGGVKTTDLLPSLINYTLQVIPEADFLEDGHDLLRRPLDDSVIVRGFGVTLRPAGDWVMTPGNIDDMYLKIILPVLRERKDASAVEYWNSKIQRESDANASVKRTFDVDQFAKTRKPELLWNRAVEFYLVGQKNRGVAEMLAVIRAYPSHPNAASWVSQLEQYLAKK